MESFLSNLIHAAGSARKASRQIVLAVIFVILLTATIVYYLNTPGRLVEEGLRYRKEKKWQSAAGSFKKALSFNMKSSRALFLLGEEYFCAGDLTRGKFYLSKAFAQKNVDGRAIYYLGALYACQGDNFNTSVMLKDYELKTGGSGRDYETLLRILAGAMFPDYPNFALTAEEEKKLAASIDRPDAPLFFKVQLGLADIYGGRFENAVKTFGELSVKYPDDTSLAVYRSIALSCCGRRDEALTAIRAAAQREGNNPLAQQYLGALCLEDIKPDETVDDLKRLRAQSPEDGPPDESLKALQKAMALSPGSSGPYYYMGLFYMKKGALNEARGFFEESLRRQPNNGMAHQKLGELYQLLGMKKEAREEFDKKSKLGGPLYIFSPPY